MYRILGSDTRASALRTLIRAAIAVATAFGLNWSAEQVAAVQVAAEAAIQAGRIWYAKGI